MWINRERYRTGERGYLNALYTTLPLWLKVMKLGLLLTVSNDLQDKKSYTSHSATIMIMKEQVVSFPGPCSAVVACSTDYK